MQVLRDAFKSAEVPFGAVVTLGNYDGIHRGQRRVIAAIVERARQLGVPSAVITFDPHPLKVLRPEHAPTLLTVPEQRERLLAAAGVDALVIVKFNREIASMKPEDFVKRFLHDSMSIAEIHVGSEFAFGHERRGNIELLQDLGTKLGFAAHGVPEETWQGEVISSSRIRRALREGQIEAASEMLGRPYSICGKVVAGDRMGKKLGWPTINLAPRNELLPGDGVYAGRVHFPKMPATFDCVTNVGTRPTIYENYKRVVESHILDFKSDVYGEEVEIEFWKRLREEKLFPNVMELSAQIRSDVDTAREYFNGRRRLHVESAG